MGLTVARFQMNQIMCNQISHLHTISHQNPEKSTIEQVLHLLSNISIIMGFHGVFISGSNIILCDFLHRNYKRAKYNNSYNPIRKLNNGDKNSPKTYKQEPEI